VADARGTRWRVYDQVRASRGPARVVAPGRDGRAAARLFVRERDGLAFGAPLAPGAGADLAPATLAGQLRDALRGAPHYRAALADPRPGPAGPRREVAA
jgi:hypothetical protein